MAGGLKIPPPGHAGARGAAFYGSKWETTTISDGRWAYAKTQKIQKKHTHLTEFSF